jgi:hypothetical protein
VRCEGGRIRGRERRGRFAGDIHLLPEHSLLSWFLVLFFLPVSLLPWRTVSVPWTPCPIVVVLLVVVEWSLPSTGVIVLHIVQ